MKTFLFIAAAVIILVLLMRNQKAAAQPIVAPPGSMIITAVSPVTGQTIQGISAPSSNVNFLMPA